MANPEPKSEELFPTIGQVVDKTDQLQGTEPTKTKEDEAATPAEDEEDRPVTEIESLCMNCEQQVCSDLNPNDLKLDFTCLSMVLWFFRVQQDSFSLQFLSFERLWSCLSIVTIVVSRITRSNPRGLFVVSFPLLMTKI